MKEVMSVGVAQLDHDQTFLQSLSPAERNDLLNAARFFREKEDDGGALPKHKVGVKRPATTGAKERAARGTPAATKTVEDERKDATWELARLRVQVTALAAENDQLRSNAQGLALQLCEAKTVARSQLGDATLKCRQTEEAAALRTASMEEQSERQRRVLAELAAAAETMANDNVLLTGEVMSLRERAKLAQTHSAALEERVRKLQKSFIPPPPPPGVPARPLRQGSKSNRTATAASVMALMMTGGERGNTTTRESQELYTTGVETVQDSNDYEAARLPVRFWDKLATPEVLALSRPPTDFPLSVPDTAPQPWEQVREFQRVREENQALQGELRDVNRKLEEARNAHAAVAEKAIADKRAAREALNHQQSQLVGALRRIQWLVERQKAEMVREEERRAYIQQLEKRLLNQHRRLHKLQAKAPRRQDSCSEGPTSPSPKHSATSLRPPPPSTTRADPQLSMRAPPSASSLRTEYATAAKAHMHWSTDTPAAAAAPSPSTEPGSAAPSSVVAPAGDGFTLADIEQFTWQLQALHCHATEANP